MYSCSYQFKKKKKYKTIIKLALKKPPYSYPNLSQDLSTREWNLVICNNMDKPWGYYAKGNKSDSKRQNTVWSHVCVQS